MNDNPKYTLLGNFDLRDARSICGLLQQKQIDFELEVDDQPIRNMAPFQAAYGGTYGSGATANIYVQTGSLEQCELFLKDF